jgi:hypothetical protein
MTIEFSTDNWISGLLHFGPIEERFEVTLPTIWTDEAAEMAEEKKVKEERESVERRSRCAKR